jgi:outer membrane autotransporter protein
MIKTLLFTGATCLSFSAPAFAGFYLNGEFNQTNVGQEWNGNAIDLHVGYENKVGEKGNFYIQGGPYLDNPKGSDSTTKASGKIGGGYELAKNTNVYGEFSVVTNDTTDNTWGSKIGVKYNF